VRSYWGVIEAFEGYVIWELITTLQVVIIECSTLKRGEKLSVL
jgi:hypothetical protein